MAQPLTDTDCMARALILLVDNKLLPRGIMMRAAGILGVTHKDLTEALSRFDRYEAHRTKAHGVTVKEHVPEPKKHDEFEDFQTSPVVVRRDGQTTRFRNRRVNPETGERERKCSRCREWKPATPEYFALKDKRTEMIRTDCRECYAKTMRKHYLSTKQRELLEGVASFIIGEDDEIIGITCEKCGKDIMVGDEVTGEVTIKHVSCGGHTHSD